MEVLAIINLVLLGIALLSSIPMIIFFAKPEDWENNTNSFKHFIHEAGPYSVLIMTACIMVFLVLSLVLTVVVLI